MVIRSYKNVTYTTPKFTFQLAHMIFNLDLTHATR